MQDIIQPMLPVLLVSNNPAQKEAFIASLIEEHAIAPYNVHQYQPEKKEFSIDMVREIKTHLIHHNPDPRIFILHLFDFATIEAQNALLKTLEEKPEQVLMVLSVEKSDSVLPTIRSRTRMIRLSQQQINVSEEVRAELQKAVVQRTPLVTATPFLSISNEDTNRIFDEIMVFFYERLKENDLHAPAVLKTAFKTKQLFNSNNLNHQLALDSLLLAIMDQYKRS
jgi:hypothetical protein